MGSAGSAEDVEHRVEHDARRDTGKHGVTIHPHPLVPAPRGTKPAVAVVRDYIRTLVIRNRQTFATAPAVRVVPGGPVIRAVTRGRRAIDDARRLIEPFAIIESIVLLMSHSRRVTMIEVAPVVRHCG